MLKLAFTFILILAMSTVAGAETAEEPLKPKDILKIVASMKNGWDGNISGQCARASLEKYTQAMVHNPCNYSKGRYNGGGSGSCSPAEYHGGLGVLSAGHQQTIDNYERSRQASQATWGGFDYENCTGRLPVGGGEEVTMMRSKVIGWHTPNLYGTYDVEVKFSGNSSYPLSAKIQGNGGSMQLYLQDEGHSSQITFLDVPYLRFDPRTSRYSSPDSSFSIGSNDLVNFFNLQLNNCTWTLPAKGNKFKCADNFFPLDAGLNQDNVALIIKNLKEYLMKIEPPKPAPAAAPTPPVKAKTKKRTK